MSSEGPVTGAITEPEVVTTPVVLTPVKRIPEMPPVAERMAQSDLNQQSWIKVFRSLPLGGVTGTLGSHCELLSQNTGSVQLRLDTRRSTLYNDSHRQRIEKALSDYFEHPLQLSIEVAAISSETPAAWRERKITERLNLAKDSIYSSAHIQTLVDAFDGQILDDSIKPIGNVIK